MNEVSPRLLFLDTARGFAALSVITWHCFTAIIVHLQTSSLNTSPFHFFWYGEADVIFFFIHSGFILSYSNFTFEKGLSTIPYIKYLIKRVFRIYPLFIFVLLISFLLRTAFYPIGANNYLSPHFLKFWHHPVDLWNLIKQGLLIIRIPDNADARLIPQDWTLTIEILLCPLIPFLNFFIRKSKLLYWVLILLLLKLIHFNTFLFEFAVGVSIYNLRDSIRLAWHRLHWLAKVISVVFAIILYTCCFGFPSIFNKERIVFNPALDRLMVVAGCSLFFMIIMSSASIQKPFSHPVLVRIGKICYSLYVIHIFLLICLSNIVLENLYEFIKGPEWLIILLFVLFFQLLNILFSLTTYHFIEKPFNKWGRTLSVKVGEWIKNISY
jgi:peptidoglycan/LPS O-acetylase OafA/YrhL